MSTRDNSNVVPIGREPDIEWSIERDGKKFGPLTSEEMRQFAELGHLRPTDLVWRTGFPNPIEAQQDPLLRPYMVPVGLHTQAAKDFLTANRPGEWATAIATPQERSNAPASGGIPEPVQIKPFSAVAKETITKPVVQASGNKENVFEKIAQFFVAAFLVVCLGGCYNLGP